ncbi:sugar phosphate isomerase/epimerase family protein [Pricia sp. S334]|uniref:Sugar phosphate isomerase/epimerase family protein n=1 Tax=Pricia mediterranea TaxID=3076079 RepID=A0ABU3L733_9FLAO|nr:sugar phosphate isomerase/epimerase family protein [Pricia sp. S334]MDT7829028.1 sugar phosphate isomerase/epimerase family protein [Pricia sp. S334]
MSNTTKNTETTSSRRNWLKNVGMLGAASMAPSLVMAGSNHEKKHSSLYNNQPIRLIVSTYSYWHFEPEKYPIEKVIENAAKIGFDGVEILHRQMENESVEYMNKLKRMAFERGLALPFLSIHQNFVEPDAAKRKEHIEHTLRCIKLAVQMGIPAIRMNTGSWKGKRPADYYEHGRKEPTEGYTDQDAIKWVIESMKECLEEAEKAGVILCLENHWGLSSNIDYLEEIHNALSSSPAMGLNLDTGNFVGEPYDDFERLIGHADIIQAKTYYGGGKYYDKDMDYDRFAKIMRDANFTGYVSLEMEGDEDPETAVPKSYKLLREAFAV